MSTETSRHFLHLLQFSKTSLRSLILYNFFHDFIYVYSPGIGAVNSLWRNFNVIRNSLSLRSFVASFKKISLKSDFIQFFFMILYMYIAAGQGQSTPGDKILMSTETSCHFAQLLHVSKKSLWSLILYNFFHDFIHVYSPGAWADNPLVTKF